MFRGYNAYIDKNKYVQSGAFFTCRNKNLVTGGIKKEEDMEFAICFKGFVQPDRAKALVRLAESAGSHIAGSTTATSYGEKALLKWLCVWNTHKKCGLDHV